LIWRIRGRQTFARLLREGTRIRATTLWCTVLLDPELTPPRVAFSIGRATAAAVERNRLRRQLRALLRDTPLPAGLWLFGLSAGKPLPSITTLRADLATVLARASELDR
jgi:ribonuclease P protein component